MSECEGPLPESGVVVKAFEDLSIKVNGGLEPRRMIKTLSDAPVRRQIETAPEVGSCTSRSDFSLSQSVASPLQSSSFPPLETGFLAEDMPPGARSKSEFTILNERKGANSDGSVHQK